MDPMEVVRRPVVHGVKLCAGGKETMVGSLCVTIYHLIYSTRRHEGQDEITMLTTAVDNVEHKVNSPVLVVVLKDFRHLVLEFPGPEEAQDISDALHLLSRPALLSQLYAFTFQPSHPLPLPPVDWLASSPHKLMNHWHCHDNRWRVTSINRGFQVCSSYPEEAIVPSSCSDDSLLKVANFRHSNRFPVLAYHHQKTKAVIVRCGQPRLGPGLKNKCKEDVQLLNACLPSLSKGKVLDTRPQEVATAKGGGVELPAQYPQWRVEYGKMESPVGLASSLARLREACSDTALSSSPAWWGRIEASGWLTHVARLLSYAKFVALCVHRDATSVVVHGAAGVDGTLQVTSLAQVLLDPHTRTMAGFADLVQREWLAAGHPFSLRHGHVSSTPEKERSPMFLLFLDCVWQVMNQFPLSFEFNERFLHVLLTHSYSSEYGTFLYDTARERQSHKGETQSLWSYLAQPEVTHPLQNPLYDRNSSVLLLSLSHLTVTLWQQLYVRDSLQNTLAVPGQAAKVKLRQRNQDLKEELTAVRKQLATLQTTARCWLEQQDQTDVNQTDHDTVHHKTQTRTLT